MFAHIGLCTHTAHIMYVMMNNTVFGYLPNAYHLIYEMWSMSNAHSIINQMTSAFKWILMLFWRYLNLKFEQRHTMIHTWFYGYFLDFGQREIWPVDGFLFHFLFLTFFPFSFCFGLLITTNWITVSLKYHGKNKNFEWRIFLYFIS